MLRLWTAYQSRFIQDEKGASMVEYALLVALIAVVVIAAALFLGQRDQRQVQRSRRHGRLNVTDRGDVRLRGPDWNDRGARQWRPNGLAMWLESPEARAG